MYLISLNIHNCCFLLQLGMERSGVDAGGVSVYGCVGNRTRDSADDHHEHFHPRALHLQSPYLH